MIRATAAGAATRAKRTASCVVACRVFTHLVPSPVRSALRFTLVAPLVMRVQRPEQQLNHCDWRRGVHQPDGIDDPVSACPTAHRAPCPHLVRRALPRSLLGPDRSGPFGGCDRLARVRAPAAALAHDSAGHVQEPQRQLDRPCTNRGVYDAHGAVQSEPSQQPAAVPECTPIDQRHRLRGQHLADLCDGRCLRMLPRRVNQSDERILQHTHALANGSADGPADCVAHGPPDIAHGRADGVAHGSADDVTHWLSDGIAH